MFQNRSDSSALVRQVRIIIPAHDEAGRIEETVTDLWSYFGTRATILVVANGCSDATADVTRSLARRFANVELLEIHQRIGKGGAVRAGLTFGREPYVAFIDADGSTAADQLDVLLTACRDRKLSGAIGSRWLPGSRIARKQPLQRRLASRAFNGVTRLFFGLTYTDTQCGAKVFERSAIDGILDRLEIANFAFDVDLLLELKKVGQPVVEIPISWENVEEYSKVRLVRSGPAMLWALLRLAIRESPVGRLPFVDTLGRSETIPVLSGLDVLFLVSKQRRTSESFRDLVEGLRERGHVARIVHLEDIGSLVSFAFWYVRVGHRQQHAIVHDRGRLGSRVLELSRKQKYALAELEARLEERTEFLDDLIREIVDLSHPVHYFRRNHDGWTLTAQRLEATTIETIASNPGR